MLASQGCLRMDNEHLRDSPLAGSQALHQNTWGCKRVPRCLCCGHLRELLLAGAKRSAVIAWAASRSDCACAGEHLRESLLAGGSAGDPHATLEAAVGAGHLHRVAGGWAPDARALLEGISNPAASVVSGRA